MNSRKTKKFLHKLFLAFLFFVSLPAVAAPTIAINSPNSGTTYNYPGVFSVVATPVASAGASITSVKFYRDGAINSTVLSAPWSISVVNYPKGTYSFTAVVTDSTSATATSSPVVINVTSPPTVSIVTPAANSFLVAPANISLTANANDSDGTVSKVEYYNGATLIGTATSSPWTVSWPGVVAGSYVLTAKATDNLGAVTTSSAITVNAGALPTIAITSPANNTVINTAVGFNLITNPATTNAGATITKVEIYRTGTLYTTITSAPWTAAIPYMASTSYSWTAKVYDSAGGTATSSPVIVKTNGMPFATILTPTTNSYYSSPSNISFTTSASDSDGTVTKVEYFNGATLIGTATASPWSITWPSVTSGVYSITAKSTDNDGGTGTSTPITVRVGVPPTVSITAPAANAVINLPGNFTFSAAASSNNAGATISQVMYLRNGSNYGVSTSAPWNVSVGPLAAGSYTFTAQASDSYGAIATSAPITLRVNAIPTANLTSPTNGAIYTTGSTVSLTSTVADTDGTISKVEYFNGATLIATATSAPWTVAWTNVPAGSYSITAKATDNDGGTGISFANTIKVGVAPTINITAPATNTVFAAPASFSLTTSPVTTNSGATISKVEFYNGATLYYTSTASPWTYPVSGLTAGTYNFTAKVTDSYGFTATSTGVTVKVNAPPTVSITSPVTNTFYGAPASIPLTATAADSDGTITKVDFYNGATLIGTATASPWTVTWPNVPAGTYTVTAVATDNNNATTTSAAITVKAGNLPTISITSPASNVVYTAPASFVLTTNPVTTNAGATISKVEFYRDGTLSTTSTSSPWSASLVNQPVGTYSYTAKVTDSLGATTTSAPVVIIVNVLPTVSITSPATNTFYTAPANITLTATAADANGTVSKVDFYNGATLIGTATASPWTLTWPSVAAGTYTVTAVATDNNNGTKTSAPITINTGGTPTATITSPTNNTVLNPPANQNVTFYTTASTPNAGATITKVQIYRNGTLVGSSTASPWTVNVGTIAPGNYSFTAVATDSLGATVTSSPLAVKVNAVPTVSITSPVTNVFTSMASPLVLTANAADSDGTVSKVEFYNGATLIGTATSAPWSVTWGSVTPGSYPVTAKATDSDGATTTSAVVNVLTGYPPAVTFTYPTNGSVIPQTNYTNMTASASTSNPGASITQVLYYKGATLAGVGNSAPTWTATPSLNPGTYTTFTVKATDSLGAIATSAPITFKVDAAPTATITTPLVNAFYAAPATVTIAATATDTDGTVTKVDFFNGSTLIGTATSSPWTISWTNVTPGTYILTAVPTDNDGYAGFTSNPVTIKVGAAPTANLTVTPTGTNTSAPSSFSLAANPATTNAGASITKVQFYANGALIGTTTASPWTLAWNNVSAGNYSLTTVVTDSVTATGTSPATNVLVGAFPPVIYKDTPPTSNPSSATRTSAFEYDPVSGLLTKEMIEPDNSELCLVTTYIYDTYGNKTSATTRNCNGTAGRNPGINDEAQTPATGSLSIVESRTNSTSFDSNGRFPVSNTNTLNQSESKVTSALLGVPTSLTGPNNLTTNWVYDTFGRVLTESRADGTSTQTAYAICDGSCPANAKYTTMTTQSGAPYSKNYFDMYGRVIKTESQDKDGAIVYKNTEYDKLGRTSRVSRAASATQALVWTVSTYDVLDRVLTITLPDSSVTKTTYLGKVTVTTNALNQTKTVRVNSQGQTTQIINTQGKSLMYQYDAFGNSTKTIDAGGNQIQVTYDIRGRKTAMNDPDQGNWSYVYNAFGELRKQTDGKSQVSTMLYDKLGRMTQRNEADLVSNWTYDTCDSALYSTGKCVGKLVKETSDNGYSKIYGYDQYGRNIAEIDNLDSAYTTSKTYDSYGRMASFSYPLGLTVNNIYSTTGYLTQVANASTSQIYWTANSTDASGNVTQETLGNGVVTNRTYNPNTGLLTQIAVGNSGSISNQSFVYDTIGNLTQRYEGATGLNESFGYDSLNRLTSTTAQSGSTTTSITVSYDAIGNIVNKSDVGTYTYGTLSGGVLIQPHAVTQIMMNDGVTQYAAYSYDANGNNTNGAGRNNAWTSWNMPTSISKGNYAYGFVYNSSHERVKETTPTSTIYNISPRLDTGIHVEKRINTSDGSIKYVNYLYAGSMPFGTVTTNANGAITQTRYFHTDHLGSIVAITDESGTVTERRSFDAWGKRRNLDGTPLTGILTAADERHGFASQEELSEVGIVHMNGRLYDPAIGRFISADPTIQTPDDMQNYNRYSYIENNPLASVDYSGYGFFSSIFHSVEKYWIRPQLKLVDKVLSNKVIRTAIALYVGYQLGTNFLGTDAGIFGAGNAIANGAAGGFSSGLIQGRGDLKIAIQGAITSAAMGYVGDNWAAKTFGNIAGHAVVGCASSVMSGGSCGSGALAGGFSGAANPYIPKDLGLLGGTIASAVIGGTASVLGGGSFENGAVTAAYGYLFNYCAHNGNCTTKLEKSLWDWMPGYRVGTCINNGDCTGADWAKAVGGTAVAIAAGVEVKGAGAAADFFAGSNYTDKVLGQMGNDLYHGFPLMVDVMAAQAGQVTRIVGGDGAQYLRLQVDGAVNGTKGTFEYIKDSVGNINHRLFTPKQ